MYPKGASAAMAGFDYQLWYVALKLADAFFDNNLFVEPEAIITRQSIKNGNQITFKEELTSVDDLVIYENDEIAHYNIKHVSPGKTAWRVSDLKKENVLSSFL